MNRHHKAEILLLPAGSAGDVYPFIGLGMALKERDHPVTVVTNPYFESAARAAGLDFIPIGEVGAYRAAVSNPAMWKPVRGARTFMREAVVPYIEPVYELLRQYDPASTVVAAKASVFGARIAQEKLGLPLVTVLVNSIIFRSLHQTPVYTIQTRRISSLPAPFKQGFYRLIDSLVFDPVFAEATNAFRSKLGLAPVRRLYNEWVFSPQQIIGLYPDWFVPPQPDWPEHLATTGFVFYDGQTQTELPKGVSDFLADGDPPVVFTPGTSNPHSRSFFQTAMGVCRELGRRALLLTPYREQLPASLPAGMLHVDFVPLRTLLPRTAALVHVGGPGTLSRALAAGIPQLIVPLAFDHPDCAVRVKRLGVGDYLTPRRFRVRAARKKLHHLLHSETVRERCQALSKKIDPQGDLENSVRLIEALIGKPFPGGSPP